MSGALGNKAIKMPASTGALTTFDGSQFEDGRTMIRHGANGPEWSTDGANWVTASITKWVGGISYAENDFVWTTALDLTRIWRAKQDITISTTAPSSDSTNWQEVGNDGLFTPHDVAKTTPVLNDKISIQDSEAANAGKTVTIEQIVNLAGSGIAVWSSGSDYAVNDRVSNDGRLWRCTGAVTNNTEEPKDDTDNTYWVLEVGNDVVDLEVGSSITPDAGITLTAGTGFVASTFAYSTITNLDDALMLYVSVVAADSSVLVSEILPVTAFENLTDREAAATVLTDTLELSVINSSTDKLNITKNATGNLVHAKTGTSLNGAKLHIKKLASGGAGSGGGLFSSGDETGTIVDVDELRFIDKDARDAAKKTTLESMKAALATPTIEPERTIAEVPEVLPTRGFASTPLTISGGTSITISPTQLTDYDWLWVMCDPETSPSGAGATPVIIPTSELKIGDISNIKAGGTSNISWAGDQDGGTITVSGTGRTIVAGYMFAGATRTSTPTVKTASSNSVTITTADLDANDWLWFQPGEQFTTVLIPTSYLKNNSILTGTSNTGPLRAGGSSRYTWTLDAQKTQGTLARDNGGSILSKVLLINGDLVDSSPLTENFDESDTLPANRYNITFSTSQWDDDELVWFFQADGHHSGATPVVFPLAALDDNTTFPIIRTSGGKRSAWTETTRTFNSSTTYAAHMSINLGGPGTEGRAAIPEMTIPGNHGISLRQGITERKLHTMDADGNIDAAMLQKYLVVSHSAARTLTFLNSIGADGNEIVVFNNSATNLMLTVSSMSTGNTTNVVISQNNSASVQKLSGKWYVV